jgi:hypothetical protein
MSKKTNQEYVDEFLANGGKIKYIEPGVRGIPDGDYSAWSRRGRKKKPTLLNDSEIADQEAKTTEILEDLKRK